MNDFQRSLEGAKVGESITLNALNNLELEDWIFEDVSDDPEYYYFGDIEAWNIDEGSKYIEVKTDGTIEKTHNILCEDRVFYAAKNEYAEGNMHCNSDLFCIVSQAERKIYVLDFKKLQKNYKRGQYKIIPHFNEYGYLTQKTYCYLLPLEKAEKYNVLLGVINY